LNTQSTIRHSAHRNGIPRDEAEDARRVQLIEVTIDSLAEVGFVGTTLGEIAGRAGVSPGLVAHYLGSAAPCARAHAACPCAGGD